MHSSQEQKLILGNKDKNAYSFLITGHGNGAQKNAQNEK